VRGSVAKRIRRLAKYVTNPERDMKRGWNEIPRNERSVKAIDAAIAHGKKLLAEAAERARTAE
jgi:hypothetical protein